MNGPADDFDHIADGALGGAPMVRPMSHDGAASEPGADVHRGGGWCGPGVGDFVRDLVAARDGAGVLAERSLADLARWYRARAAAGAEVSSMVEDWLRLLDLEAALALASAWHLDAIPMAAGGATVSASSPDRQTFEDFSWPTYNLAEIVLELARRVEARRAAVRLLCSQQRCGELAAFRYRWPGEPAEKGVCLRHAGAVRNVASALGMPGLELVPVVA